MLLTLDKQAEPLLRSPAPIPNYARCKSTCQVKKTSSIWPGRVRLDLPMVLFC